VSADDELKARARVREFALQTPAGPERGALFARLADGTGVDWVTVERFLLGEGIPSAADRETLTEHFDASFNVVVAGNMSLRTWQKKKRFDRDMGKPFIPEEARDRFPPHCPVCGEPGPLMGSKDANACCRASLADAALLAEARAAQAKAQAEFVNRPASDGFPRVAAAPWNEQAELVNVIESMSARIAALEDQMKQAAECIASRWDADAEVAKVLVDFGKRLNEISIEVSKPLVEDAPAFDKMIERLGRGRLDEAALELQRALDALARVRDSKDHEEAVAIARAAIKEFEDGDDGT
jgi:hypothetical protein